MKNNTFIYSENRFNKTFNVDYSLSKHAIKRCQQRGISIEMILSVIKFGNTILKQGFTFYYCTSRCLPIEVKKRLNKNITDLVIVVNDREGIVVTSYWCGKGMIHIKKKSDNLLTYRAA